MANLYESDSFNIVSVFNISEDIYNEVDQSTVTSTYYLLKVQRLPEIQYPQLTDVHIYENEIAQGVSKEDFLASAPSIVSSRLAEYDAEFSGEVVSLTDTSSLIENFV